jgi:hypothetical protein
MQRRVEQVVQRAQEILAFGEANLADLARPIENWSKKELVQRLRALQEFSGIGPAAAFHILMDLHWNVVKPDRHICRFLSRIGGIWEEEFVRPGVDTLEPHAFLTFQEKWRSVTTGLLAVASSGGPEFHGVKFPAMRDWRPRHFDMVIMLYTQDIASADRGWRPVPLCQAEPICTRCAVESCAARTTDATRATAHLRPSPHVD